MNNINNAFLSFECRDFSINSPNCQSYTNSNENDKSALDLYQNREGCITSESNCFLTPTGDHVDMERTDIPQWDNKASKNIRCKTRRPDPNNDTKIKMRRWRAKNVEKNKMNDLRCRVNRAAKFKFGSSKGEHVSEWIQKEIKIRLMKKQKRESTMLSRSTANPISKAKDIDNANSAGYNIFLNGISTKSSVTCGMVIPNQISTLHHKVTSSFDPVSSFSGITSFSLQKANINGISGFSDVGNPMNFQKELNEINFFLSQTQAYKHSANQNIIHNNVNIASKMLNYNNSQNHINIPNPFTRYSWVETEPFYKNNKITGIENTNNTDSFLNNITSGIEKRAYSPTGDLTLEPKIDPSLTVEMAEPNPLYLPEANRFGVHNFSGSLSVKLDSLDATNDQNGSLFEQYFTKDEQYKEQSLNGGMFQTIDINTSYSELNYYNVVQGCVNNFGLPKAHNNSFGMFRLPVPEESTLSVVNYETVLKNQFLESTIAPEFIDVFELINKYF
ncbi:hypothetical protein BB560_004405 [Smittium megazygosporum]|uniref:DUF3020 domain-containing protein n=1 Tax=Smittium megazygosporum TaxID=133381 RepID=A0A2T9Z9I4_9FUNG|nr:hypothetical protein BB560_004405 [Smittium megazygosporum]